jgi:ABC-type antimicrobial peptide transport system permease subunit
MAEHMDIVTMPQRLGGLAAALTGVVELALAVMALYGVIAFATAQRTREIGLRIALGASSGSVARLIMRDGLTLAGFGIGLGVAAALGAGPVLGSLLIGVGAADPLSFGAAAVLLVLVAAIASYLPARRALRVDPSVALRSE